MLSNFVYDDIMKTVKCFLVCFMICCLSDVYADNSLPGNIVDDLAAAGFEEVVCYTDQLNRLYIQYENRIYRDEIRAMSRVLDCADRHIEREQRIVLVPLTRGLVNSAVSIHLADYRAFKSHQMNEQTFFERIHFISINIRQLKSLTGKPANRSAGKVDIAVLPGVNFQLGNYEDRVKLNLNIYPNVSMRLWKGGNLQIQPVIPVFDEIFVAEDTYDKSVRLSRAALSQFALLPGDFRFIAAAGAFVPDRWGVGVELNRMFFNRSLLIGGRLLRTGFLLYQDQQWNFSTDMTGTGSVYTRMFIIPYNLSAGLQYEQFLMGDHGVTIDLARYFGETRLGFYVTRTDRDTHGGFRFTIPFSSPRHAAPGRLRLRWGEYYVWNYKASSEVYTYGGPIDTGISVQTGTNWTNMYERVWPACLKNNLQYFK